MSKRIVYQWLAGLGALCAIILLCTQNYNQPLEFEVQSTLVSEVVRSAKEITATERLHRIQNATSHTEQIEEVRGSEMEALLQRVTDQQRNVIRRNMKDYRYPNGKYNINASKLEDLVLEENGRPIRSIILTTWRSGSTFLGDILHAHPASFYYFEPFLDFRVFQIRGFPIAEKALERVRTLLNCQYENLNETVEYGKINPWVHQHNPHVSRYCNTRNGLCSDHRFFSAMCKLSPFQAMKFVRLRLNVAQELLADEQLEVRMVLLVRDPRGTMHSRKHCDWCTPYRDCSDPGLLCADLVSDYEVAIELLKKYPNTFKVIRYEDFADQPYERAGELAKFYGLDFLEDMEEFLKTHTNRNRGTQYSTYRDTKAAPFHWKTELDFEAVEEIQRYCTVAMEHWGYVPAMNASHQKEFHPLTDLVLT